jgi:hypothetical protein
MRKSLTLALALALTATAYVIATKDKPEPLQQSLSLPTEIDSVAPITNHQVEPISSTQELDESIPSAHTSNEQRAAAVKATMTEALAPSREVLVNWLMAQGLAPVDSEKVVQGFIEGFADCLFEAVRKEYEAQGMGFKEFLDGAEMVWTQTLAYINLNRVQSAAVPCVTNISQQTGIPLPANFGSAGSQVDRVEPLPPSPPWAADMEARIRDHIASYPAPSITGVLVKCLENGCNALMVGRDIRIFDLEFDVFAEQNGFKHAVLGGDSSRRFVWLQR